MRRVFRALVAPFRIVAVTARWWAGTYQRGASGAVPPVVALRRTVALAAVMGAVVLFGAAVYRVIDADSGQVAAMGSAGTAVAVFAAVTWPRR